MHHGQKNDHGSHTDESPGRQRTGKYEPMLSEYEKMIAENPHVNADGVTSVRFRNGKIRKGRGRKGHRAPVE